MGFVFVGVFIFVLYTYLHFLMCSDEADRENAYNNARAAERAARKAGEKRPWHIQPTYTPLAGRKIEGDDDRPNRWSYQGGRA